ncbi:MAG: transketolase, partial [Aminivibrio sp.]|nr:transketolase [Aminivibrio sp.]
MNPERIAELKEKARAVRLGIIEALGIEKRGHLGGSLSCADIVAALYFYKMRHDPKDRFMPDRDRF